MSTEPQDQKPREEENVNAEAIRQARRRVQEREAAMERERRMRTGTPWEHLPETVRDTMDPTGGPPLALIGLLMGGGVLISGLAWLWANMRWPSFYIVTALDAITGARVIPTAPWLIWSAVGAMFGAALGYWLMAPVYGNRENRGWVLLPPIGVTLLFALLVWAFVH